MKNVFISLLFAFVTGCSVAPFSSTNTGRSLGGGVANLEVGNVASNYYIRTMYGVGQNMDAGFVMEFGDLSTSGLLLKYSVLNNKEGFSWALEGSMGGSGHSDYTFFGPIFSVKFGGALEFYSNFRYVSLDLDEADYDVGESIGGVKYEKLDVRYLYSAAGLNVWFTENLGLNLYITYYMGSDVKVDGTPFGASIIANF